MRRAFRGDDCISRLDSLLRNGLTEQCIKIHGRNHKSGEAPLYHEAINRFPRVWEQNSRGNGSQ